MMFIFVHLPCWRSFLADHRSDTSGGCSTMAQVQFEIQLISTTTPMNSSPSHLNPKRNFEPVSTLFRLRLLRQAHPAWGDIFPPYVTWTYQKLQNFSFAFSNSSSSSSPLHPFPLIKCLPFRYDHLRGSGSPLGDVGRSGGCHGEGVHGRP